MKFRLDFVTNSSSSSYIIAMTNDKSHHAILDALVECTDDMDTGKGFKISTIEELDTFIMERRAGREKTVQELLENDEYAEEMYTLIKQAIESGKSAVYKNIGYDAVALYELIEIMAKNDPENILILMNDN